MEEKDHNDLEWVEVGEVSGDLQAEILGGMLEAQGIPVFLSHEGAGKALGLEIGGMGLVKVLVPSNRVDQALGILQDYDAGALEDTEFPADAMIPDPEEDVEEMMEGEEVEEEDEYEDEPPEA